jgi:hypothetical protein
LQREVHELAASECAMLHQLGSGAAAKLSADFVKLPSVANSIGMKLELIPAGEFRMGSGRSATRFPGSPDDRALNIGFRVARSFVSRKAVGPGMQLGVSGAWRQGGPDLMPFCARKLSVPKPLEMPSPGRTSLNSVSFRHRLAGFGVGNWGLERRSGRNMAKLMEQYHRRLLWRESCLCDEFISPVFTRANCVGRLLDRGCLGELPAVGARSLGCSCNGTRCTLGRDRRSSR